MSLNIPSNYVHFPLKIQKKQGVISLMYITKWFLTMYTTTLPWEIVLRIWDLFYSEGKYNSFIKYPDHIHYISSKFILKRASMVHIHKF